MKVKIESEVAQSCPTLHDPMDCSLPGSSLHWVFQAKILEWVSIAFYEVLARCQQIRARYFLCVNQSGNVKAWHLPIREGNAMSQAIRAMYRLGVNKSGLSTVLESASLGNA